MNQLFERDVALLLDRLEPPALSAGFAERIVALAETAPAVPPLPKLRRTRPARRRWALAIGLASLVGVAAAAAVVPARVWRDLPVIGALVELIAPAKPALPPPVSHNPILPAPPMPPEPVAEPPAAPPATAEAASLHRAPSAPERPAEAAVAPLPPGLGDTRQTHEADPAERTREILPEPVRERPTVETERGRTIAEPVRTAVDSTPAAREPEPAPLRTLAPERTAPAETRQIIRETTAPVREAPTRERIQAAPRPAPVERTQRTPAAPTRN